MSRHRTTEQASTASRRTPWTRLPGARLLAAAWLIALFLLAGLAPARAYVSVTVYGPSSMCTGQQGDFSANVTTSGCESGSGGSAYYWYDGSSFIRTTSVPYISYTPTSPGTHTMRCDATVPCGSATGYWTYPVQDSTLTFQSASASAYTATTCDTLTFNASATGGCGGYGMSYTWDFKDNTGYGYGSTVTHTFPRPGTYTVTVRASTGSSSASRDLQAIVVTGGTPAIVLGPVVSNKNPATTCDTVVFSVTGTTQCVSASISYSWEFGDGATGTGPSTTHRYSAPSPPGGYLVRVTGHASGLPDASQTLNQTVTQGPAAGITINSATASPSTATTCDSIYFTASATENCEPGYITYSWQFGDGQSGTGSSVSHTYGSVGTFTARVTASDGTNSAERTVSVTINSPVTVTSASASPSPATLCDDVTFSAQASARCGPALTYDWDFGDQTPHSSQTSPRHRYGAAGTYTAHVTVTSGGFSAGRDVTLTVNANPAPGITVSQIDVSPASPTTCDKTRLTATASENCQSDHSTLYYQWSLDNGLTWTDRVTQNYLETALPAGSPLNILVRVDDGTLSGTGSKQVNVTQIDAPSAPQNLRVTTVTIKAVTLSWDAVTGADKYQVYRSTDDVTYSRLAVSTSATYTDSTVQSAQTTTYYYKVSAIRNCYPTDKEGPPSARVSASVTCSGSVAIDSVTAEPPTAEVNQEIQFHGSAHGACPTAGLTYTWDFDDGSETVTGTDPKHAYSDIKGFNDDGSTKPYKLKLTVSDGVAADTRTLDVLVDWNLAGNEPGPDDCPVCVHESDGTSVTVGLRTGNLFVQQQIPPVPTRGLPLFMAVSISSQAVERHRAMGNATHTYDMHVAVESVKDQACQETSRWILTDGDGKRLDYGPAVDAPLGEPGTGSELVPVQDGFELRHAGEPGSIGMPGICTYKFNALGQLTQIDDGMGNTQVVQYAGGHATRVVDVCTQRSITLGYGGGHLTSIALDGGGTHVDVCYTGDNLASSTVRDGGGVPQRSIDIAYNPDGSPSRITPAGNAAAQVALRYTPHAAKHCGDPVLLANGSDSGGGTGVKWGVRPSPGSARSVQVTNANGGVTTVDFSALGDVVGVTKPTPAGAAQPTVYRYVYDNDRRLTGMTVNGRSVAAVEYTPDGLFAGLTDGLQHRWSLAYEGMNATGGTDPVGTSSSATYGDPLQPHVPTSTVDPAGNTWALAHNASGQPTMLTPPPGSPTGPAALQYDETLASPSYGWPRGVVSANGDLATIDQYDPLGHPLQVSTYPVNGNAAVRNTVQLSYDGVGRLTAVTQPDGRSVQSFFCGGMLDHVIDEAGTRFDVTNCASCGIPTRVAGPLGWSITVDLDGDRKPIGYTDARNNRTSFGYGAAGELTSVAYPDGAGYQYLYDDRGRVRQQVNGRGHQTTVGYDDADRVTQVAFPSSGEPTVRYEYYDDDMPRQVSDGTGTTSFTYYPTGQVQSVTYDHGVIGLADLQQVYYTYNPDGTRSSMTWSSGGQMKASWSYSYNTAGRLIGVTNSFNELTTYGYDGEGKLKSQLNANGTSVTIGYNEARGWPTAVSYSAPAGQFAGYSLTYDNGNSTVGKITHVDEQSGGSVDYGYDALYRMTGEQRTGSGGYAHTYGYDLAGNPTTVDSTTRTYDAANKITSVSGGGAGYDQDGNLTWAGGYTFGDYRTFTYDDQNHVTSANYSGTGLAYKYDGLGHLVNVTQNWSCSQIKFLVYDGSTVIGEIVQQPCSTPNVVYYAYTWGPGGLVSQRNLSTNTSLWYAFGPQGETRQLTDASGNVVDSYMYTAYGQPISASGSHYNPFRFGGQYGGYTDYPQSGVVLLGARWYDPYAERWLTRDPSGNAGGDNLYAYCSDDPVNGMDPTGMYSWRDFIHDGLALGVGVAGGMLGAGPFGVAIASALFEGIWAFAVDNQPLERCVVRALTEGGLSLIGGKLGEKALGAIAKFLRTPLGEKLVQRFGCRAQGFQKLLCERLGTGCFAAGTMVLCALPTPVAAAPAGAILPEAPNVMAAPKPIEQVKAGDRVVSYDDTTGATAVRAVTSTSVRRAAAVLDVELSDARTGAVAERFTLTPDHPLFVKGTGYVPVGQLQAGTAVLARSGQTLVLSSARLRQDPDGFTVYNLIVDEDHSYYVGTANGGVLAHNGCYQKTFRAAHPELNPKDWVIHHSIPQRVLGKFRGMFTAQEIHALENLRGVPRDQGWVHTLITNKWQRFFRENPNATREQILAFRDMIDGMFGGNMRY